MNKGVRASMRSRETLSALIEGRLSSQDGCSEHVKLATRLILEEALEPETREALGRDCHERGAGERRAPRNGHRTSRPKTAKGEIAFPEPRVAGREEAFRSEVREHAKGRPEALEGEPFRAMGPSGMANAVVMPARGLSVRDIEDALRADDGRRLVSRTAVSELGDQLWRDCQDFAGAT